jgi:hypothetical protein
MGKSTNTENLKNITLPVFHIMGSLDVIAPPETIRYGYNVISPRPPLSSSLGYCHRSSDAFLYLSR